LIYKILTVYKTALWEQGVSPDALMPDKLGTSETHIRNLLLVLRNAGLIIGTNGQTVITLAGLEYLESNEQMKRIAGRSEPYSY
jgi:hypothetical protein